MTSTSSSGTSNHFLKFIKLSAVLLNNIGPETDINYQNRIRPTSSTWRIPSTHRTRLRRSSPLIGSSERPLTVQSSAPPTSSPTSTSVQHAVLGIAIPVTDSPVESAPNTIEHVESSCEVVYSLDGSSSEDIELLEAQAMAARAMLRLAGAKNKKKKPSSTSARSGRSSYLLQIIQHRASAAERDREPSDGD